MMDIGIDFGSTYSLITTFDQERQSLIELKPAKDVAVTPSSKAKAVNVILSCLALIPRRLRIEQVIGIFPASK